MPIVEIQATSSHKPRASFKSSFSACFILKDCQEETSPTRLNVYCTFDNFLQLLIAQEVKAFRDGDNPLNHSIRVFLFRVFRSLLISAKSTFTSGKVFVQTSSGWDAWSGFLHSPLHLRYFRDDLGLTGVKGNPRELGGADFPLNRTRHCSEMLRNYRAGLAVDHRH
eukprot:Gb_26780 [translate_table: standard]